VKTFIYRQHPTAPGPVIEWEEAQTPQLGETIAIKSNGRERVYGTVTKIHYIVEDGKYFRHIIIANN